MKGKWHSGSGPDMVEQVESVDGVLEVGLLVVLVVVGCVVVGSGTVVLFV